MCWKYEKPEDAWKELQVLQHVLHSCQTDKEWELIVLSRNSRITGNLSGHWKQISQGFACGAILTNSFTVSSPSRKNLKAQPQTEQDDKGKVLWHY